MLILILVSFSRTFISLPFYDNFQRPNATVPSGWTLVSDCATCGSWNLSRNLLVHATHSNSPFDGATLALGNPPVLLPLEFIMTIRLRFPTVLAACVVAVFCESDWGSIN